MSDQKGFSKRQRWSVHSGHKVVAPKVDDFIEEIIVVCKKHNMSISHEDGQGGFIIESYDEQNANWLRDAMVD